MAHMWHVFNINSVPLYVPIHVPHKLAQPDHTKVHQWSCTQILCASLLDPLCTFCVHTALFVEMFQLQDITITEINIYLH